MNEPKTPWPEEEKAHQRWEQSVKTGHTQLWLKCQNCGLEFIIMTWRTGAELAAAFGIYGGIEPTKARREVKMTNGKTVRLPFPVKTAIVPMAEQVCCPECGERGRACLCNYRRVKGAISNALSRE